MRLAGLFCKKPRIQGKLNVRIFGFDIITIIFLVIAVVLFMRLRDVLGTRTGNERDPYDPYSEPDKSGEKKAPAPDDVGDNVISLPDRPAEDPGQPRMRRQSASRRSRRKAPASMLLSPSLMSVDKNFDPEVLHFRCSCRL